MNYGGLSSEIFISKVRQFFKKEYGTNIQLKTYFKSANNLAGIFRQTCKFPGEHTSPGVYEISCRDCNQKYIGETFRSVKVRSKEHRSYVGKTNDSAISQHVEKTGHHVNFEEAHLVYTQNNLIKRKIAEALLIKETKTVENNTPSFPLLIFG